MSAGPEGARTMRFVMKLAGLALMTAAAQVTIEATTSIVTYAHLGPTGRFGTHEAQAVRDADDAIAAVHAPSRWLVRLYFNF